MSRSEFLFNDEDFVVEDSPLDIAKDERTLVTQPYDLGVRGISQDIDSGRISLEIEYQRKYVWDKTKASRLIESLLLNIPIPVCYFAEDDEGVYEVIDGLQRLTSIDMFLRDDFRIVGVPVLDELNGKLFSELSAKDQRRLENRTIRCIVITADSHPDIKFDVFERLNTGAARLFPQELRNSVYRGNFNDSLKELTEESRFKDILGNFKNNRMGHEELVLRYFSLRQSLGEYRPPIAQLLNVHMRKYRQTSIPPNEREFFLQLCGVVRDVFGATPFQSRGSKNDVNRAQFDAVMMATTFADWGQLGRVACEVHEKFERLKSDEDFQNSIARATADRTRMYGRIRAVAKIFESAGVDTNLPFSGDSMKM